MMNYRKFMKNSKAISPIFAILILIAIAVIAGVVVYMFVSGTLATMTASSSAVQEKVAVQGVSDIAPGTTINVYAENMGAGTVTVNGLIIKDSVGTIVQSISIAGGTPLVAGTLTTVSGTITALTSDASYTVTLTTTNGGSFVSASFIAQ